LCITEKATSIIRHLARGAVGVGPPLAQNPEENGVEGAGFESVSQPEASEAAAKLTGGLTRERESESVADICITGSDPIRDPAGEDACLAGTCAGNDGDQGRFGRDGATLIGIEVGDQPIDIHHRMVGGSTVGSCRSRGSS
jgi:hypothetical protein